MPRARHRFLFETSFLLEQTWRKLVRNAAFGAACCRLFVLAQYGANGAAVSRLLCLYIQSKTIVPSGDRVKITHSCITQQLRFVELNGSTKLNNAAHISVFTFH